MEPTNADIRADFQHHAEEDHKFQEETRLTDKSILDSLASIHEKLERQDERMDALEKKIEPILQLVSGLVFSEKAIKWTSGLILAITVIVGSIVAVLKWIKG